MWKFSFEFATAAEEELLLFTELELVATTELLLLLTELELEALTELLDKTSFSDEDEISSDEDETSSDEDEIASDDDETASDEDEIASDDDEIAPNEAEEGSSPILSLLEQAKTRREPKTATKNEKRSIAPPIKSI